MLHLKLSLAFYEMCVGEDIHQLCGKLIDGLMRLKEKEEKDSLDVYTSCRFIQLLPFSKNSQRRGEKVKQQ